MLPYSSTVSIRVNTSDRVAFSTTSDRKTLEPRKISVWTTTALMRTSAIEDIEDQEGRIAEDPERGESQIVAGIRGDNLPLAGKQVRHGDGERQRQDDHRHTPPGLGGQRRIQIEELRQQARTVGVPHISFHNIVLNGTF